MKKTKYLIVGLLVSIFAITGCSKKNDLSVEETFKKAVNNVNSAENFKMNIAMNIGVKAEGLTMDMNVKLDSISDIKNGKTKMTMGMNMLGISYETEMYTDTTSESDKTITYTKDTNGNWSKTVTDTVDADTNSSTEFLKNLADNDSIKQLKADKDNYNYEVTINADTLKSLMSEMNSDDTIATVDTSALKGDIKIKVSIDKDTYNYSQISMDMTDMMKKYMKELQEGVEVTKAEFIINFSDYNKAGTVTIPDEALNANVIEDDWNWDDGEFFDDSDYDKVLTCTAEEGNIAKVGFIDDKSILVYVEKSYNFDSIEEARKYYDEYETEVGESKVVLGSTVTISYSEIIDENEQLNYDETKAAFTSQGLTCN